MAKPQRNDRLGHILEAIEQIENNVEGLTLDTFKQNRFVQLGIERCLEIISEASRHLPQEWKDEHPTIPWRRVADIGNRIRHVYHAIDGEIIWEIVQTDLEELKLAIEAMQD